MTAHGHRGSARLQFRATRSIFCMNVVLLGMRSRDPCIPHRTPPCAASAKTANHDTYCLSVLNFDRGCLSYHRIGAQQHTKKHPQDHTDNYLEYSLVVLPSIRCTGCGLVFEEEQRLLRSLLNTTAYNAVVVKRFAGSVNCVDI